MKVGGILAETLAVVVVVHVVAVRNRRATRRSRGLRLVLVAVGVVFERHGGRAGVWTGLLFISGETLADAARDEEFGGVLAEVLGRAEDDVEEETGRDSGDEEGEVAFGFLDGEVRLVGDVFFRVGAHGAHLEEEDHELEEAVSPGVRRGFVRG